VEAEDLRHMLFGCGRAHYVWKCLDLLDAVEAACETDRAGEATLEEMLNPAAWSAQYRRHHKPWGFPVGMLLVRE
jgi:hypothetical protein